MFYSRHKSNSTLSHHMHAAPFGPLLSQQLFHQGTYVITSQLFFLLPSDSSFPSCNRGFVIQNTSYFDSPSPSWIIITLMTHEGPTDLSLQVPNFLKLVHFLHCLSILVTSLQSCSSFLLLIVSSLLLTSAISQNILTKFTMSQYIKLDCPYTHWKLQFTGGFTFCFEGFNIPITVRNIQIVRNISQVTSKILIFCFGIYIDIQIPRVYMRQESL